MKTITESVIREIVTNVLNEAFGNIRPEGMDDSDAMCLREIESVLGIAEE